MHARKLLLATAALGALAAGAGTAQAADDTTSVAIAAGALEYTTPLAADNFPNVTLSGASQTVTANASPYVVTDSRGGAAGWNLTIAATQFATSGSDTLPTGSMRMTLPPVPTTTLGNLGIPPVVTATPLGPIDGAAAQKVASAAAVPLGGAGRWTFTPLAAALALTVPPAVTPGTYTSTITTTLATGP